MVIRLFNFSDTILERSPLKYTFVSKHVVYQIDEKYALLLTKESIFSWLKAVLLRFKIHSYLKYWNESFNEYHDDRSCE